MSTKWNEGYAWALSELYLEKTINQVISVSQNIHASENSNPYALGIDAAVNAFSAKENRIKELEDERSLSPRINETDSVNFAYPFPSLGYACLAHAAGAYSILSPKEGEEGKKIDELTFGVSLLAMKKGMKASFYSWEEGEFIQLVYISGKPEIFITTGPFKGEWKPKLSEILQDKWIIFR